MFKEALSVSQYGNYIKNIFDAEIMLQGVSIYGEISGWQCVRDNAYFSIKDDNATISCVMFGVGDSFFKDGESVVVTGSPNYYVKGGKLSFNVRRIERKGLGSLFENFLKLKAKLESEGLFDQQIKKSLPKNIKKVGVVTSATGAVLHDIVNVCTRRNPFLNLVVFPARVQGEYADIDIAKGIAYFENTDVDVVIVARGGGSQEDLSCFNTEVVARAGFSLSKPLISAVGHETDFTIIDFVADVRASTPSVAGELVSKDVKSIFFEIKSNYEKMSKYIQNIMANQKKQIEFYKTNLRSNLFAIMSKVNLENKNLYNKICSVFDSFLLQKKYALSYNELKLQKLNPNQILSMGYVKVEQKGQGINSVYKLEDESFELIFSDGQIKAKKES